MTKAGYINIVCTPLSAGVGKREVCVWGGGSTSYQTLKNEFAIFT